MVLLRATNSAPAAVDGRGGREPQPADFFNPLDNDTDPDTGDAKGIRGNTNPRPRDGRLQPVQLPLHAHDGLRRAGLVHLHALRRALGDGDGHRQPDRGGPRNPVGSTDFYTATINKPLSFDLDKTSFDADGGPLTYSNFSALAGLSCAANGACTYTGTAVGNDFPFTFTVTDNTSRTGTGTIHIQVVPNQLPRVPTQFMTVVTGGTVPITLAATDPDGDTLTFGDISKPQKGALTCTTPPACT